MNTSRHIETLVRPDDNFARDARGRPLRADENEGLIRVVTVIAQSELAAPASCSGMYWLVMPFNANESVDFDVLRSSLEPRMHVAMGIVAGARPGAGAVLLVPTLQGFALHSVAPSNPCGPFERLFSQRRVTLLVENWSDVIAGSYRQGAE